MKFTIITALLLSLLPLTLAAHGCYAPNPYVPRSGMDAKIATACEWIASRTTDYPVNPKRFNGSIESRQGYWGHLSLIFKISNLSEQLRSYSYGECVNEMTWVANHCLLGGNVYFKSGWTITGNGLMKSEIFVVQ